MIEDTLPRDEGASEDPGIQGEGDYVSGRRYQKDATKFANTHDTGKLARKAAPKSRGEAREMDEAERKGKARAKGTRADKSSRD